MVSERPKPRYSEQIENGVLYFLSLGNTRGKMHGIQSGNRSAMPTWQALREVVMTLEMHSHCAGFSVERGEVIVRENKYDLMC